MGVYSNNNCAMQYNIEDDNNVQRNCRYQDDSSPVLIDSVLSLQSVITECDESVTLGPHGMERKPYLQCVFLLPKRMHKVNQFMPRVVLSF